MVERNRGADAAIGVMSGGPVPQRRARQSAYLHGALTALLLLLFAVWNKGPIFYPDTHDYLSRPANLLSRAAPALFHNDFSRDFSASPEHPSSGGSSAPGGKGEGASPLLAGRSPYWGILAFLTYSVAGFTGIMAAQALLLGIVLALAWFRGFGLGFDWRYYAAAASISTLTSAGVYVAFLTPDILAPALILSMALLILRWEKLSLLDRVLLCAIACLAAVSHDSHIPVALAMAVAGVSVALFRREPVLGIRLFAVVLPVVVGFAGLILLGTIAKAQTGRPLMRLPFLSAHLADMPEGEKFLVQACPQAGYELCHHLPALSQGNWIDFLFATKERGGVFFASPQPIRDRLSEEQGRVFLDALRANPLQIGSAFLWDGVRQIGVVDLAEIAPDRHIPTLRLLFNSNVMAQIEQTRSVRRPDLFAAFDRVQSIGGFAGAALLFVALWARRRDLINCHQSTGRFVLLCVGGILANAIVCGLLASPLGRFQARVSLLFVFLAVAQLLAARKLAKAP